MLAGTVPYPVSANLDFSVQAILTTYFSLMKAEVLIQNKNQIKMNIRIEMLQIRNT